MTQWDMTYDTQRELCTKSMPEVETITLEQGHPFHSQHPEGRQEAAPSFLQGAGAAASALPGWRAVVTHTAVFPGLGDPEAQRGRIQGLESAESLPDLENILLSSELWWKLQNDAPTPTFLRIKCKIGDSDLWCPLLHPAAHCN